MLNLFARAARPAVAPRALVARAGAVALSALLLASCGGGGSSNAPTPSLFSTVVVVGASLTDTGNVCPTASSPGCPPVPPYAAGRFSNGTLFVETIAARYGASVRPSNSGGTNFAFAGARTGNIPGLTTQSTTPSMVAQLDRFIASPVAAAALNPQTLFVIDASTFGNNINAGFGSPTAPGPLATGAVTPTAFVTAGVTDIVTIMTRLYNAGARNMLVINVPNVGNTPLLRATEAVVPGIRNQAAQLSGGFSQALAGAIQTNLLPTAPGLRVFTLDLFTISNAITANPAAAGLTDVAQACVNVPTCVSTPATADTFLYWDTFHPTRAAGAYIAAQAAAVLPAP